MGDGGTTGTAGRRIGSGDGSGRCSGASFPGFALPGGCASSRLDHGSKVKLSSIAMITKLTCTSALEASQKHVFLFSQEAIDARARDPCVGLSLQHASVVVPECDFGFGAVTGRHVHRMVMLGVCESAARPSWRP